MLTARDDAFSEAQDGLQKLKNAVSALLAVSTAGLTNYQIAQQLGLEVSFAGAHKNYLTYTVLRLMVQEGSVPTKKSGKNRFYLAAEK